MEPTLLNRIAALAFSNALRLRNPASAENIQEWRDIKQALEAHLLTCVDSTCKEPATHQVAYTNAIGLYQARYCTLHLVERTGAILLVSKALSLSITSL